MNLSKTHYPCGCEIEINWENGLAVSIPYLCFCTEHTPNEYSEEAYIELDEKLYKESLSELLTPPPLLDGERNRK